MSREENVWLVSSGHQKSAKVHTHRIRDKRVTDERTGETTHRIRGNRLIDERTGETTHRIRE